MNEFEYHIASHNLQPYLNNFISNGINSVSKLINLRYTDLEGIGIIYVKDKRRIYDLICLLRNEAENKAMECDENHFKSKNINKIESNVENKVKSNIKYDVESNVENIIESSVEYKVKSNIENNFDFNIKYKVESNDKNKVESSYKNKIGLNSELRFPHDYNVASNDCVSTLEGIELTKELFGDSLCNLSIKNPNKICGMDFYTSKINMNSDQQNLINKKDEILTNKEIEPNVCENTLHNVNGIKSLFNNANSSIKHKMLHNKQRSISNARLADPETSSYFDSSIAFRSGKVSQDSKKSLIQDIFRHEKNSFAEVKPVSKRSSETVSKKYFNEFSELVDNKKPMTTKITVSIRKKPIDKYDKDIVECSGKELCVKEPKTKLDLSKYVQSHQFHFDNCYDVDSTNDQIFEDMCPIYDHIRKGGNATIIAYGQTGTGKTHTMFDSKDGLIIQYIKKLFVSFESIKISFYEIYNGSLFDLFDYREKILLREKDGFVFLTNLTQKSINTVEEAVININDALSMRKNGKTEANTHSSRSHAIFRITLNQEEGTNSLVFVDLAGSERGSDRKKVDRYTNIEGAEINKSLLALKECIRGIGQSKEYLPFRQSKLTQILKSSFIGDTMTCIIATINPGLGYIEHTINTLRYASRLYSIQNKNSQSQENLHSNSIVSNADEILRFKKTEDFKNSCSVKYNKGVFDSTFTQENSSESNFMSFLMRKNIDEQNLTVIYKKKINKLTEEIIKECANVYDVRTLRKVIQSLKGVIEKISEMKY